MPARNVHQPTKRCSVCGETKPREEFKKKGGKSDRRYPYCSACFPEAYQAIKARQYKMDVDRQRRKRHGVPVEREQPTMVETSRIRDWLLSLNMERCDLAEWLGTNERAIYRWISGEAEKTNLDFIDKCLCYAGVPWVLRELFPELWEFDNEMVAA